MPPRRAAAAAPAGLKRSGSALSCAIAGAVKSPMVPPGGPVPATDPANVEASLVGWAIQRAGGGRGFVMTGVDWHENLKIDAYRRVLLNGIVWAAGLEVPAGGVQCKLP